MELEVIEKLIDHSSDQIRQMMVAIVLIVEELKKQPGFDVKQFEANLLIRASRQDESKDRWVRLLLEIIGGKDSPESPDAPESGL